MRKQGSAAAVACVCGVVSAGAASGGLSSFSVGSDLAGGTVTVTWYSGPGGGIVGTSTGVIGSPSAGEGLAEILGPGGQSVGAVFRVNGDTFLENWTIENTADAIIGEVVIDLAGSLSVFDNGVGADSLGSGLGLEGAEFMAGASSAPEHVSAVELDSWVSPLNAGDLFTRQVMTWNVAAGVDTFGIDEVFVWRDDTDLIPAPAGALALAVGGVVGMRRRR